MTGIAVSDKLLRHFRSPSVGGPRPKTSHGLRQLGGPLAQLLPQSALGLGNDHSFPLAARDSAVLGPLVGGIALSIVAAAFARHISSTSYFRHYQATALLLTATLGAFGCLWIFNLSIFNRLFRVAPLTTPSSRSSLAKRPF